MAYRFQLPVDSYLVLMAQKSAPRNLPERIVDAEEDGFRIETPYEVVRLWEIDPRVAFEPGCEPLLPWVPLLRGGQGEIEQAIAAMEKLAASPQPPPNPLAAMADNQPCLRIPVHVVH